MTTPDARLTPDDFVTIPRVLYDALLQVTGIQADLEQVILQVLEDHYLSALRPDRCSCGYRTATQHAWHQHIADHITDQLQENQ